MKNFISVIVIIIVMIQCEISVKGQVSTGFNFGVFTDYVGWNAGQNFPLEIRHNGNQPINFFTNTTRRATILANGNFGISSNGSTPGWPLDVDGDINISPVDGIYRIGDIDVLKNNGLPECIFVGLGAGGFNAGGAWNTFVGCQSGLSITGGDQNAFLGAGAGMNNTNGRNNTFTGFCSGLVGTTGNFNTFLGAFSGANII
jgi:hypothetical protein